MDREIKTFVHTWFDASTFVDTPGPVGDDALNRHKYFARAISKQEALGLVKADLDTHISVVRRRLTDLETAARDVETELTNG